MATEDNAVFFDANMLMSIIFKRSEQAETRRIAKANVGNLYISTLTGHLVFHFGKKDYDMKDLREFISDYILLPLEPVDFEWAYANIRDDDFEDALQLAVAIRHGCTEFTTFDKKLYKTYKSLPNIRVKIA